MGRGRGLGYILLLTGQAGCLPAESGWKPDFQRAQKVLFLRVRATRGVLRKKLRRRKGAQG